MGKGDKKTKRGKIIKGSFGKTRPHKKKQSAPMEESKAPVEKPREPGTTKTKAKSPAATTKTDKTDKDKKAKSEEKES